MDRAFGGSLGLIAFLTVLARGGLQSASLTQVMMQAWLALWCFAFIGYVAGRLAQGIIDESVRARLATELDQHAGQSSTRTTNQPPVS